MHDKVIPDNVSKFILERIESVAELEGLLILRQTAPQKWDAGSLASRLYISQTQTDKLLTTLCNKGLAIAEDGEPLKYYYGPANPELCLTVECLASFYAKHIVPVTNLIHSRPKYRIQGFADAFKFRKDD